VLVTGALLTFWLSCTVDQPKQPETAAGNPDTPGDGKSMDIASDPLAPSAPPIVPPTPSVVPPTPSVVPPAPSTNAPAASAESAKVADIAALQDPTAASRSVGAVHETTTVARASSELSVLGQLDMEDPHLSPAAAEAMTVGVKGKGRDRSGEVGEDKDNGAFDENSEKEESSSEDGGNGAVNGGSAKKGTVKTSGARKSKDLSIMRMQGAVGEMEEYDEEHGRRTPTEEDYVHWRTRIDQNGSIEDVFKAIAGTNIDWSRLPEGVWNTRPGGASEETKARLEAVAQGMAFLVSSIAADAGITKAHAWKLTGLLQAETRASNAYNLFCKKRAVELRAENNGNPGKHLLPCFDSKKLIPCSWRFEGDQQNA
jgi:hypothetical protein